MRRWPKETHEARKTSKFGSSYDEKWRVITFMLRNVKGKDKKSAAGTMARVKVKFTL
jgi:hypothetical protein